MPQTTADHTSDRSTLSLRSLTAALPLALQKYLCAATAASIAETVTMPLDVMKTRMQLDLTPINTSNSTTASSTSSHPQTTHEPRRGLLATGKHIYTTEGFKRLYLGLTPAVLRQAIVGGIGVGLYPQIKDFFLHMQHGSSIGQPILTSIQTFSPAVAARESSATVNGPPLSFGTKVLAGATSGVIGQICAAPTCVVKVRLQADARLPVPRYHGTWHAFTTIPAQEGFSSLWKGIVPSLQRAAVMYGATISTYDHLKHYMVEHMYHGDIRAMDFISTHVAASSVSGFVASVVSTPFDTIKTRIISQTVQPRKQILGNAVVSSPAVNLVASSPSAVFYSSTIDCVMKTVRSEGLMSLYKGFLPCYARLAPWQLVFFISFEQLSIAMTGQSLR